MRRELEATIAANRFGLGAGPGELARVRDDPRGWLLAQLAEPHAVPPAVAGLAHSSELVREMGETRMRARELRRAAGEEAALREVRRASRRALRETYLDQAFARVRAGVESEQPFVERLVRFWTNHFATSADKQVTIATAATLENEAIRAHVGGRFADMLLAVEQHPAMITYLDNQWSAGPHSPAARWLARRRGGRRVGLNENLAREILELHTVGVDAGYGQEDVTALARAITGWSIGGLHPRLPEREPGRFTFFELMHEPGAKTVMGRRYPDRGLDQGRAVLADLAAHPATARHVATKLVRHFVADEPPAQAVARIERAFLASGGHLPSVHAALVDLDAAWARTPVKLKAPEDLVVSTFRALGGMPRRPRQALGALRLLGQPPYQPGSPAGWPDTQAHWGSPDAVHRRVELAVAVGRRTGGLVDPMRVAERALGAWLDERTRRAVERAESPAQGLALVLASPEFQRR